jgi:hypothetical protein
MQIRQITVQYANITIFELMQIETVSNIETRSGEIGKAIH